MKVVILTTDNREHSKDYSKPHPYFGAAPEALLEGFAQLSDTEVHVVSCIRKPMRSPERLAANIYYHGLVVPKIGWMSTGYQGCIRAVRKRLSAIKPDIVHGQGTERDCAMEAVYSGRPNVLTIHGNMAELLRLGLHGHRFYGPLAALLETHTLRRTAGVFCNSAYTESLVAPRARRTWRVPNPIRLAFFQPKQGPGPSSEVPQLLNVGLVSPRKRQLELLRTAGEIARSGRKLRLIFAGALSESSEYGKAFAGELRRAEEEGYAAYAGFLDSDKLIRLMDESHAFIHFPSEEAFGLVVAEAMARGLKFFGADLGGIRDIAEGIDGTELYGDFSGLKGGLRRWLDTGAPLPPSAATQISERYHPSVIAARHLQIYRDVLG